MGRFCVITRFWGKTPEDLVRLSNFVRSGLDSGAEEVLIGLNVQQDKSGLSASPSFEGAEVVPIQPWGFAPALNALFYRAYFGLGYEAAVIASVEVPLTQQIAGSLLGTLSLREGAIAVGGALPGHDFKPGWSGKANGIKVPWFTLCALATRHMMLMGVPPVVDLPWSPGVEEILTFGMLQHFLGPKAQVFVTSVPGISWNVPEDPERRVAHEAKMASKGRRPSDQLKWLSSHGLELEPPWVQHI